MAEFTIISEGAALIGTGAWFADKVFGPSAEALGESLKAYLSRRIASIFDRAGSIARQESLALNPIAPGLLARMVMDASFSGEDAEITEWWANLLLEASRSSSNKHAIFSDIMAMMGPREAQTFSEFLESAAFDHEEELGPIQAQAARMGHRGLVAAWLGELPGTIEGLAPAFEKLNREPALLPSYIRFESWQIPLRNDDGPRVMGIDGGFSIRSYVARGENQFSKRNFAEICILERLGLVERVRHEIAAEAGVAEINTIIVTWLGLEFYISCTGRRRKKSAS